MTVALDTPIRTGAQNLQRILDASLPSLLVFETPDCKPCRDLEPTLNSLAGDFAGKVLIVRVEDAQQEAVARRFNIRHAPTLVLWQSGKEVGRIEGAARSDKIRDHLNYLMGNGIRPATTTGPSITLSGNTSGHLPDANPGKTGKAITCQRSLYTTECDGRHFRSTGAAFAAARLGGFLGALVWALPDGFPSSGGDRQTARRANKGSQSKHR